MDAAVARPGFWQRVVAFSVDSAVLSLASSFLQPIDKSGSINLLAALVYYTYFWSGAGGGRTWGMRVMGLRVVREDGSALSVTRALIRFVGLLVSFFVLLIGLIWVAFDAKKQGWHDKFAGSLVVADTPATFPPYPVTLSVAPNTSPQRFWAVPVLGICVKLIALIPVFVAFVFVGLALAIALLVLWIPVLTLGTYPGWGRAFLTWAIRWSVEVNAFLFGLTDRYPSPFSADPAVKLEIAASPTSSRLWAIPVFGIVAKLIIFLPAYFLQYFVNLAVGVALAILWAPVLTSGVYLPWGHRFIVTYMRWGARTAAYLTGLTDTYPRIWNWEQ